jgi:hypothetical protein
MFNSSTKRPNCQNFTKDTTSQTRKLTIAELAQLEAKDEAAK